MGAGGKTIKEGEGGMLPAMTFKQRFRVLPEALLALMSHSYSGFIQDKFTMTSAGQRATSPTS